MRASAYDRQAEHFDVLVGPMWQALAPALTPVVTGLDPRDGPVADIGAGTGRGTELIAAANPGSEVLAVEPSQSLRAVLLSRIGRDPGLADRVTVLPGTAASVALPERLAGMALCNSVADLAPDERAGLWRSAARRLAPGAPLVINLGVPGSADPVTEVRVGRRRYRNTGTAEPAGPDTVRWTITTQVYDQDRLVDEVTTVHTGWQLGPDRLCAELAAAGLRPERSGVLVVARR